MRRTVSSAIVALGLVLIVDAGYIQTKALVAQHLLERSWNNARAGKPRPPWPWADTVAVARLDSVRLAEEHIVLSGASGRNLAFGPAHVAPSAAPGEMGHVVLSGHRDTHFGFIYDLVDGDVVSLEASDGVVRQYRVFATEILDLNDSNLPLAAGLNLLTLSTCYPRSGPTAQRSKRYLVHADLI